MADEYETTADAVLSGGGVEQDIVADGLRSPMTGPGTLEAAELVAALDAYRPARKDFLQKVGVPSSNRDPPKLCENGTHDRMSSCNSP